jgi:hypothetical protein
MYLDKYIDKYTFNKSVSQKDKFIDKCISIKTLFTKV